MDHKNGQVPSSEILIADQPPPEIEETLATEKPMGQSFANETPTPGSTSQLATELSPAVEISLPEKIPPSWLEDIKKSVKDTKTKTIVTIVLSSSLISGVLTSVLNHYFFQPKATARQQRQELTNEKIKSYKSLNQEIDKLFSEVSDAETTFQIVLEDPKSDIATQAVSNFKSLIQQQADLTKKLSDSNINEETRKNISDALNGLGSKVMAAKEFSKLPTKQRNPVLKDLISALGNIRDQLIPAIRLHIQNTISSLIDSL